MTRREQAAIRAFARQLEREGFPDWGVRCKHGMQGGLWCEWCGNPDRLPAAEKLRGTPRVARAGTALPSSGSGVGEAGS